MAAYDINVYQSEALTEHCSETYGESERWRSARRIADYLEHAVTRPSAVFDGDVDVTAVTESVPAPVEDTDSSITTVPDSETAPNPPCEADSVVEYQRLLQWWMDYGRCQLAAPAADSNLLVTLTDYDYGGWAWIGPDPYATARVGKFCARLPDPGRYRRESYYYGDGEGGDGDEYFAMNTAIHEIGHNIVQNVENPDGPDDTCSAHFSAHHRMGTVYRESGLGGPGDVTITDSPMSHGSYNECMRYDDGANACANEIEHDIGDVTHHDLRYSPCAVANLEQPAAEREQPAPVSVADGRTGDGTVTGRAVQSATVEATEIETDEATATADEPEIATAGGPDASAAEKTSESTETDRRSLLGTGNDPFATDAAASDDGPAGDGEGPNRGGASDGDGDREPDVRIVDNSASPAPVRVSLRYVGEKPAGGSVQQVEVSTRGTNHPDLASTSAADRRREAVETIERLRTTVDGLHEIEVSHRGHSATANCNVGGNGAADEETVDVQIRPDGSVAVGTAVRCEETGQ